MNRPVSSVRDKTGMSPDTLRRVTSLFTHLNWATSDTEEANVFSQFCAMLDMLKSDERDMIISLTNGFFHCSLATYGLLAKRLAERIVAARQLRTGPVITIPLVKPEDIGKIKSGSLASYVLLQFLGQRAASLGCQYHALDRPDLLSERHSARTDALILLVDDFVGSGVTAVTALRAYEANWKVASDRAFVVALVAQEQGQNALAAAGGSLIAAQIRTRGISDSSRFADRDAALALMDGIEKRLRVPLQYRRGYMAAEALVAMARCPNDTFPVYWTNRRVNGAPWPAPFTR